MTKVSMRSLLLPIVLLLTACTSVTSTVKPDSIPSADAGYIVGLFTKTESAGVGLEIVGTSNGPKYLLPFGEDSYSLVNSAKRNAFAMIQVSPGEYQIKHWVTYAPLTREPLATNGFKDPAVVAPFRVRAGEVVFIGNYSLVQQSVPGPFGVTLLWNLRRTPLSLEDVRGGFMKAYSGYSQAMFSCMVCSN